MIYTELTKKAMDLMFRLHRDQRDKSGMPYVFHPFHVAEQMDDEISTCVALLHDVVEDTPCTLRDLRDMGFPEEVCAAVEKMTHPEGMPYLDYVARIRENPVAAKVKLADLRHNSDLSRLDAPTEKDLRRVEKYRDAMALLAGGAERDISFPTPDGRFNYRTCAVFLKNGALLAMRDEVSPYYYLPGGRVRLGETAEEALRRELREELRMEARLLRPLWLNQSFFTEDVSGERFHELCVYYLADAEDASLLARGERFSLPEGRHTHAFEWLPPERVRSEYLYPLFIKDRLSSLPENLEMLVTRE